LIASLEGTHDGDFRRVFGEARRLAAYLFQTQGGEVAILPALEEAAPEAVLRSLVPSGSRVVVGTCGAYGERLAAIAQSLGYDVRIVEGARGYAVPLDAVREVVRGERPRAVLLLHGEGATGVLQPLEAVAESCRAAGTLLMVDASFTLAAVDLPFDAMGIDAAWSGTQRGLSALPGLTLVALSALARERLSSTAPAAPAYLDLRRALDGAYDTFPAPLLYALDEVLQLCADQGLAYRFSRIANRQQALIRGLEAMGLVVAAAPGARLPSVTAVRVPDGVDGEEIRRQLLARFRLEIGGPVDRALGPVWRVGIMGHSAAPANILLFLSALEVLLETQEWIVRRRGEGTRAALGVLEW
jgi:alanine-glyoxylate transaminase/serine-glyoxylate transaminase/serine-pyruvate transaminase